jgi:hypothetical protein
MWEMLLDDVGCLGRSHRRGGHKPIEGDVQLTQLLPNQMSLLSPCTLHSF